MLIVFALVVAALMLLILTKRMNIFYSVIFSLVIIYFILYPRLILESAAVGLRLFINALFPTVFPFLVVCNLLIAYDGVNLYSKVIGPVLCFPLRLSKQCSLPLTISILCGYPLGAIYSSNIYEQGLISDKEYTRLLNIASNAGPLFIIGPMATAMLNNPSVGYLMLFGNYISCFVMSLLIPPAISIKADMNSGKNHTVNFGSAMKKSLEDATKTCINIAGFVIIFSVLIYIVNNLQVFKDFILFLSNLIGVDSEIVSAILLGTIEITNGCYILSQTQLSMTLKVSLASFLCSFSGLSIISQVHSFTYKFKCFSFSTYTIRKLLQGLISFVITYILCYFSIESIAAFDNIYLINKISFIPFMILLIISLVIYTISFLFERS